MDNNELQEETEKLLIDMHNFMDSFCRFCKYERCKDLGEEKYNFFTCPFIREVFERFMYENNKNKRWI